MGCFGFARARAARQGDVWVIGKDEGRFDSTPLDFTMHVSEYIPYIESIEKASRNSLVAVHAK